MIKRWCAYNYLWVMRLLAASMLLLIPIFRYFDPPMLVVFLIILSAVYFIISFPRTLPKRLILKDRKILDNDCDPYPLLKDTEALLPNKRDLSLAIPQHQSENRYIGSPNLYSLSLTLDHCVALHDLDQSDKAIEKLLAINVADSAFIPLMAKASYFQSLSVYYLKMDNLPAFQQMKEQFLNLISRLSPKEQLLYEKVVQSYELASLIHAQDYEAANILLQKRGQQQQTNREKVYHALSQARIYLYLNKKQAAKEQLNYVLQHGNQLLCAVNQAAQLIKEYDE